MSDESPKQIVTLVVGLLLIAYLGPEAITALYNASTGSWDSGAQNVWSVLGIIVVVGFMMRIIPSMIHTRATKLFNKLR